MEVKRPQLTREQTDVLLAMAQGYSIDESIVRVKISRTRLILVRNELKKIFAAKNGYEVVALGFLWGILRKREEKK